MRCSKGASAAGTALIVSCVLALGGGPAGAVAPVRDGTVSCTAKGTAHFAPALQFSAGNKPNEDATVKVRSTGSGCSGTQTGGSPRRPGPIAGATFVAKGHATGHRCIDLTNSGIQALKTKITWRDTGGASLGITTITAATATVANLGDGNSFGPPTYPPPGIITITLTGTAAPTSTAFPGRTVHATFVADNTVDSFMLPCTIKYPPQKVGLDDLPFTGVQGPSSVSVS